MGSLGRRGFMTAAGSFVTMTATGTPGPGQRRTRPDAATATEYVDVQLLNITDLHGYLQAPPPSEAGHHGRGWPEVHRRAASPYLAAHLESSAGRTTNSIFFAPGDNFSGWPFEVDVARRRADHRGAERAWACEFTTAGNHEFDAARIPDRPHGARAARTR